MQVLGTTSLAQTISLQTLEGGPSGEGARWWLSQGCRHALMLCHLLFSSTTLTHRPCKCDFCYIRHCVTQNQSGPREFWVVAPGDLHREVWEQRAEVGFEDKGFCEWMPRSNRTVFHHFSGGTGYVMWRSSARGEAFFSSVPSWECQRPWPSCQLSQQHWTWVLGASCVPAPIFPVARDVWLGPLLEWELPEDRDGACLCFPRKNKSTWSLLSSPMNEWVREHMNEWMD